MCVKLLSAVLETIKGFNSGDNHREHSPEVLCFTHIS
jgi:hypothetical protein